MAVLAALANRMKKKKLQQDFKESVKLEDPFSGVKGYHEEVARLKSVAAAIKDLASGKIKTGQMPRGIMLSGDPGMGKTTLARAFVKATGLKCFLADRTLDSDLVHSLYKSAKAAAPSIVLIDDIDKILPVGGSGLDNGFSSDEARAVLSELVAQLDGLSKVEGIVTVMTSNEYESLDDSFKRPGRIDVHIPIGKPTDKDREEILSYYMSQYGDVFPPQLAEVVSKKAHDLSCAAIRTIVNDVWLQYYSAGVTGLDWADCFQRRILEYHNDGILKKIVTNDEDFWRICYHEAGHAVVEYYLTNTTSDICVLQVSGSDTGGWTLARKGDDARKIWRKKECENELAVLLGGLAAEVEKYGEHSLSVSSDLDSAYSLLSDMRLCDIPSSNFANVIPAIPGNYYTESGMATLKDKNALKEFYHTSLNAAVAKARETIVAHKDKFEVLADYLYKHDTASGEVVESILKE